MNGRLGWDPTGVLAVQRVRIGRNLVEVETIAHRFPNIGAVHRPWAGGRNAFGVQIAGSCSGVTDGFEAAMKEVGLM